MKSHKFSIAVGLFTFAAIASAGEPQSSLRTVTVRPVPSSANAVHYAYKLDCTPPNSATECAAFHREIRRNFSSREIGMLFGAVTAYPEARTAYFKVAERFDAFTRVYDEQHLTAFASR